MSYALNFDIFFAIALVGMIISAIFRKSRKYSNNFILFLLTTVVIGLLVYFKVDEQVFNLIGGYLQPIFAKMGSVFNKPYLYGLFYFAFLLVIDIILFLLIKLILCLFSTERRKFKKDLTYTPKHHGFASFLVSILKFALLLEVLLICFEFANVRFGFDISNSYVIKYFEQWEKPLIDLLKNKGIAFFKAVGY